MFNAPIVAALVLALAATSHAVPSAKPAPNRGQAIDLLAEGQAFEARGDLESAIARYQQSAQLAPSPAAYYHLGRAHAGRGDTNSARQYLSQALALNPEYELAKLELHKLGGGASAGSAAGGTQFVVQENGPVDVAKLQREYQTVNSLKRPVNVGYTNVSPADEEPAAVAGFAATPVAGQAQERKNVRGFLRNFIPRAGQFAGAGRDPQIPSARAVPTPAGTARQTLVPPDDVAIVNESEPKMISPEERPVAGDVPPEKLYAQAAPAQYVRYETTPNAADAPIGVIGVDTDEQEGDPLEPSRLRVGAAQEVDPADAETDAGDEGGAAPGTAAGGSPTLAEVNAAAFGAEARDQAPSVGYGNRRKVALGTFAFHRDRADRYREAGRWKEAAEEYAFALCMSPGDTETRTLYAEVLQKTGNPAEAETQALKAEAIAPNDPKSLYRQGNIYRDQQKHDLAIGAYRRAIELDPSYVYAHNNLGVVYMESRQYSKAAASLKRVLELEPGYEKAMLNLGIIYDDHLGDDEAARKYYQMYIDNGGERAKEVQGWMNALQ